MAIIFNVLPPDEPTIDLENLLPGSFFRPIGNTQRLHVKIGESNQNGDIPVVTLYPGRHRGVLEAISKTDNYVLVEDITMSFPAFEVKEEHT